MNGATATGGGSPGLVTTGEKLKHERRFKRAAARRKTNSPGRRPLPAPQKPGRKTDAATSMPLRITRRRRLSVDFADWWRDNKRDRRDGGSPLTNDDRETPAEERGPDDRGHTLSGLERAVASQAGPRAGPQPHQALADHAAGHRRVSILGTGTFTETGGMLVPMAP